MCVSTFKSFLCFWLHCFVSHLLINALTAHSTFVFNFEINSVSSFSSYSSHVDLLRNRKVTQDVTCHRFLCSCCCKAFTAMTTAPVNCAFNRGRWQGAWCRLTTDAQHSLDPAASTFPSFAHKRTRNVFSRSLLWCQSAKLQT